MSEIPKAYEPQAVEEKWYQFWLTENCFVADPALAQAGVFHRHPAAERHRHAHDGPRPQQHHPGHPRPQGAHGRQGSALAARHRPRRHRHPDGRRKNAKKAGEIRHRDDLGREKFLEHVWAWKEKHGGIIIQQLKKLGASCDWTRERFTMDPEYSRCVQKVFVELYKKGLIYRGKRMVNWCPASLTALSDEEVNMKEQKGLLYYFKVEVRAKRRELFLTIATTRPETIPGDTAVAVNPKDPRYAKIHRQARRPSVAS